MKAKMKDSTDNHFAIVHMVGQLEQVGKSATALDVSLWMGVSKTTAIARIKWMGTVGLIDVQIKPYRKNAVKIELSLSEKSKRNYALGTYKRYYDEWVSKKYHVERTNIGSIKAMFV